jgi:dTMP kinase
MLIAIEGIDGSGKGTQARRLATELDCRFISFPQYNYTFFSSLVKKYLVGELGDIDANHPLLVSLLYSLDRWEYVKKTQEYDPLVDGRTVVFDRYVSSNVAHQGAKLPAGPAREQLLTQIERIEFDVLGLPRPDLTILMDIPAEYSYQRAQGRRRGVDMHEGDSAYLRATREAYRTLATDNPAWQVVNCIAAGSRERNEDEIAQEISQIVKQFKEDNTHVGANR